MKEFDFSEFPQLETKRLVLRQITMGDAGSILRLLSNPKVIEHDTFELFTEKKQAEKLIEHFNKEFAHKRVIFWGISIKENADLIGFCKCEIEVPKIRADIGYDLCTDYWKRGIMTETLRAVIDFTFSTLLINRIEAAVAIENTASSKLLQKVGFTKEAIMRERSFWKGRHHDMIMYAMLKKNYNTGFISHDQS